MNFDFKFPIIQFIFTPDTYKKIGFIQKCLFNVVTFLFPALIGKEVISKQEYFAREEHWKEAYYQTWLSHMHKFIERNEKDERSQTSSA